MAKLSSCYPLCPLIDRSPIGVTSDSVPGNVIVTLGKNIVIRYKLADQKQASSWSSKDKLSSPVIYDERGKQYIAVFNQCIVRTWDSTEVDLNKVKKVKFDHSIHAIIGRSSPSLEPVVIFKNGAAVSLSAALANRKKLWCGPISSNLAIRDCFSLCLDGSDSVAIVTVDEKDQIVLHLVDIDAIHDSTVRVPLQRQNLKLLGLTTMHSDGAMFLFSLWSDGQLFSLPLKKTILLKDGVGSNLYTVKAVSCKNVVAMAQISKNHLAIYGADPSEEGAMLVILNTQFMLVQAHQHYKLFSNITNLWIIGANLLLVVGHCLAVVPFLLETERLCALIGSHKPLQAMKSKQNDIEQILEMETVVWDEVDKVNEVCKKRSSHTLQQQNAKNCPDSVSKLISQGYSQTMLCENLIPSLLEEFNIPVLLWLLKNFPDFPESALVLILRFCLDTPVDTFNKLQIAENGSHTVLTDIDGEDSQDSQNTLLELSLLQRTLLDVIIKTPFSEATILPCLRSTLNLQHCLALLQYIAQCLPQTANILHVQALLRWAAVFLDSNYQQLLLSKDECVSSTVTALKELVESQVEYMDDLKQLHPILERIKSGLSLCKPRMLTNSFYSIEIMRLY